MKRFLLSLFCLMLSLVCFIGCTFEQPANYETSLDTSESGYWYDVEYYDEIVTAYPGFIYHIVGAKWTSCDKAAHPETSKQMYAETLTSEFTGRYNYNYPMYHITYVRRAWNEN